MFKISAEIYDRVIRLHIQGYSMGEIAKIIGIGISKTTVHNIIHDWNRKISAGNIEDVRFFMRNLRESGITIEKCIEGLRIQQMLKEFGISDEPCDWIVEGDEYTNSSSGSTDIATSKHSSHILNESISIPNEESLLDAIDLGQGGSQANGKKNARASKNSRLDVNPVSLFVQILYNECKTHKLAPVSTVKWIRDMLDFFSVPVSSTPSSYSSYLPSTSSFLPPYSTSDERPSIDISKYVDDEGQGNSDSSHVNGISPYTEHTSFPNVQKDPSANVIDLPFVSKASFFIDQKKDEINKLLQKENKVKDSIQKTNEQKIKIVSEVDALVKKHEKIFRYFRWYKNLDQELSTNFNLKLENEIEAFSKAINDFKHYDYDPYRIISIYKDIESLNQARESILAEINQKTPIRDHLSREVSNLNNQLGWYNQTINIYNELCNYGFELKELKILRQTLAQIATANNMRPKEIGRKFLKDVQEQYDDKVGFENKISELKIEKAKIEEEVPNYKSTLTFKLWVVSSLSYLYDNKVTDLDIIFISNLVSALFI